MSVHVYLAAIGLVSSTIWLGIAAMAHDWISALIAAACMALNIGFMEAGR